MKFPLSPRARLVSFLCTLGVGQMTTVLDAASYDVSTMPAVSPVDGTKLRSPRIGGNTLHVLAPNLLELVRVNGKSSASGSVDSWNFVSSSATLTLESGSGYNLGSPTTPPSRSNHDEPATRRRERQSLAPPFGPPTFR